MPSVTAPAPCDPNASRPMAGADRFAAACGPLTITPAQLLAVEAVPGLPADRVPRLHAVAEAAQQGRLSMQRLHALPPEEAAAELRQLPGIGPFYASLVVLRALGHVDVLPDEGHARAAVEQLYGRGPLPDDELERLAQGWRPFRTWVMVMARAVGDRLPG